jgi:hypothetical protein
VNAQNDDHQLANLSEDLTSLHNARARVRIGAAEREDDTVGSVLRRYRNQAGLTEQELATWLGIAPPVLADLAEELRPMAVDEDGDVIQDMGLDQLADMYGADRTRLLEAFSQDGP